MKKLLFYFAFAFIGMQAISQTWQGTGLTSVTYLPIVAESHNNELYATVSNGFTASLNKLNTNTSSWDTINTDSIKGSPRFLQSAGTKLYMSTVNSLVYSYIYYSTDGGNTFVMDTAGLPFPSAYGVSLIYGLQYYNGKIIANLGSGGYFLKDTSANQWHPIPVVTALNGGADPITYSEDTLFSFDNTGTNTLYVSGDYGTTWMARTTDLPSDYHTSVITGDNVTGRLYSFGTWSSNTMYGLYYSDNGGMNWTQHNISSFLSLNTGFTPQLVTAMYASDQTFYMALENNANASAPDVVGTTTGLANLAYDTLGLPANAPGGLKGVRFFLHQNKLALAMNTLDVYIKGTGGSSSAVAELSGEKEHIILFPNPSPNNLHIIMSNTITPITYVKITSPDGKVVLSENLQSSDVDITSLAKGIYFIQLFSDKKLIGTQRFVHN